MGCKAMIDPQVESIGGKLKVDEKLGAIVTFYHKKLSESELDILSRVPGVRVLAFYVCNIECGAISAIGQMKSIERVGFYSCPNITDHMFQFLKGLPNLKSLVFVDTPVSKKAIDEYKDDYPGVEVKSSDQVT